MSAAGPERNRGPAAWRFAAVLALALGAASAPTAVADGRPPPVVVAGGETLRGAWSGPAHRVAAFLGVPFAAPPVGEGRWRAPVPPAPRPGIRDATRYAAACMQGSGAVDWYVGVAEAFGQGPEVVGRPLALSEDCLYLNAWTPSPGADAALPIMVFVHGGGNSGGWSYEPNYVGANLASHGVVVVTVAYRLGPFGFFAHPALDNGPGQAVSNFGLLDLRAAFEWIRSHGPALGGDPGRITAFGESAGALNLVDLLLAELATESPEPPFRRLVSQSIGGPLAERQTLAEEQALWGRVLAETLPGGTEPELAARSLRALSAGRLLEAAAGLPDDYYPDAVIDGRLIRQAPLDAIRRLRAEGIDVVLGTNADEWLMYLPESTGGADVDNWITRHGGPHAAGLRVASAARGDPRRTLDWLTTGQEMLCPSYLLAEWANRGGGRGWVYRFERQRQGPGGDRLGAYHGAELPYVFDTHDAWLPTTPADLELTRDLVAYWTAFARLGAPEPEARPAWPAFGPGAHRVMAFGEGVEVLPAPDLALCRLLGLDAETVLGPGP